jgi:hypothetical protein
MADNRITVQQADTIIHVSETRRLKAREADGELLRLAALLALLLGLYGWAWLAWR